MLDLDHPNVIKHIPSMFHHDRCYGLLTEFARFGDFYNVTKKGLLDNEMLMRTYFHQLIEGIEYIHSQGVAHLDLKLENIMIGESFELKIIDFDQAQKTSDEIMDSGGSASYRAPEVTENMCIDMKAADVFSAGVILFTFVVKEFPFLEIEDPELKNVQSYNTFDKDNESFWKAKFAREKIDQKLLTEDFIELINGMLARDVQKRLKVKDVKASKWYNKPILDAQRFKEEMTCRIENLLLKRNKAQELASPEVKIQKVSDLSEKEKIQVK